MLFNAVLLKKYPKKQDVLACVALLLGVGITFAGSMDLPDKPEFEALKNKTPCKS